MSQVHDFVVCIDFDRTLSDEARIDRAMFAACSAAGVDVGKLRQAKSTAEANSESFSILDYLTETQPSATVERVKAAFKHAALSDGPLYDDALPFLESLRDRAIPYLILTQGTVDWQELKIIAAQLHSHAYQITEEKDKGRIINGWRGDDTIYQLPPLGGLKARKVVLVDDKAKSFASLPADCSGFLIRRPDETVLPSQAGQVPANVRTVRSLLDCAFV